ncbi:long-chain acyl-CoA synthetase [Rhodoligotrophos appendicifer]|uniref:long-chain-fatty-acid--CoA ligase n=1 Tax=Rhodoligotrophos appendicifer TaxID=987056 RepID=UPI001FE3386D|nr:long-chain fatty acid--CoA ligase [Rhodoligotrophos appendicifer]
MNTLDIADGANSYPWLKAYPPGIDWHHPLTPQTLPDMFDLAVQRYGSKPCTNFLGEVMSYAEMGAMTDELACGLSRLGVGPDKRVGLVLPNTPYFIAAFFAVLKLGGTIVNFNPLYTVEELRHQAQDAGVSTIITVDLAAVFEKVRGLAEAGVLQHVVVCPFRAILPPIKGLLFSLLKRKQLASVPSTDPYVELSALTSRSEYPKPIIDPMNDVAVFQYTGGTTGTPKGAMLTHANLSINVQQVRLWFSGAKEGEERMMAILPFFHVFALTGVMNFSIAHGFEMILMPRFNLVEAITLISKRKPTILPGVPTIFNALVNHPGIDRNIFGSLKYCISGGAPLPLEVRRKFEALAGCRLVEGYGLSETSPVTHINPFDVAPKDGSIGLPVPGTVAEIRSLDDPSAPLPCGEKGELCISGPQVMKGYWNQPEETAKIFLPPFLRTGDVGYMDEEGYVYLVDRIKDIIIASGFNVYPRRIEEAIHEHPDVAEVTVIGVPDEYRGEAPKAFIRLRDGAHLTEQELLTFLKPKLSVIEMPREVEFRSELPKTMIGKLSKKELR